MFLGLNFDILPNIGGSLGNVFTCAEAGLVLRLGSDLTHDFGPPRIRPGLPGSSYLRPRKGFLWYVFGGFQGRAVLKNIFLDVNTLSDSHSVEKKPFVGDLQAGLVFPVGFFSYHLYPGVAQQGVRNARRLRYLRFPQPLLPF